MNKKLISLAVAAAMTAPAAAMADAVIYGTLHMSLDYVDVDSNALNVTPWQRYPTQNQGNTGAIGTRKFSGFGLGTTPRSNRIGLKGSEDLGNGLKAVYQVELGVGLANEDNNIANGDTSSIKMRNSYVGLASAYGTLLMGRHDTPLKMSTGKLDLFSDTLADYNYTIGFQDVRADSAVAYVSPNWSGFNLSGAVVPSAGATIDNGWSTNADSIAGGWSVAGTYSNGPFYASAAYEALRSEFWAALDPENMNTWKIGLGLMNYSGFTLTGIYEKQNNTFGFDNVDTALWQVQAQYAFGNNAVKGMYGRTLPDTNVQDPDATSWAIGLDHNFSKRTSAYLLYSAQNQDVNDADYRGASIGMIHKF
jgi:predicted porin